MGTGRLTASLQLYNAQCIGHSLVITSNLLMFRCLLAQFCFLYSPTLLLKR